MAKCCVCGEPVVNGRCIRCGMICREDDGIRYHLNENARDHEKHSPGSRKFSAYSNANTAKNGRTFDHKAAGGTGSRSTGRAGYGSAYEKSAGRAGYGGARQTAAYGGTGRAGQKLRMGLAAAVILFALFEAIFSVRDDLEEGFRKEENEKAVIMEEETGNDGDPVLELSEDEVYWWTEKEMPSTGDYAEITLEAGCYFGGYQIPVGTYTVEADQDCTMSCRVEDEEELIYVGFWISGAPDENYGEYARVENVRIYQGTQISFMGTGSVRLISQNAQSADLAEPIANPNTAAYLFEIPYDGTDAESDEEGNIILPEYRILTAGTDFEPGTYDILALSGALYINADYNGRSYESLDLDASEKAYQCGKRMKNITFRDGDKIYLLYLNPEEGKETVSFELRPSKDVYEDLFADTALTENGDQV